MSDRQKEIFAPYTDIADNALLKGRKIVFREEQNDAIDQAVSHLSKAGQKRKFLWNAKMRFGKTLCAMEVVRRLEAKTTLIVTHRPVVDDGWREDFKKIFDHVRLKEQTEDLFSPDSAYKYGSRSLMSEEGEGFYELTKFAKKKDCYGVYFVSLQYLALSEAVGGKNAETQKKDILSFPWDMVIVDEAHEGTQTDRGQNVLDMLAKSDTKMLYLSGTPFNLYDGFADDEVYTWDYVMEQTAKEDWDSSKGPNPYLTLPRMNIFTYDLGNLVVGEGASFSFAEFFRTKSGSNVPEEEQGKFVHEEWVNKFLDKLCEDSATSNYPFSTDAYREAFNHTLWVVPGVKEAKALEDLLVTHEIFSGFDVVNVAGDNEDDEASENALVDLRKKIGKNGRSTYTITLSCGRLTTGVTVPEWSAVFYLKGSENTAASTYMQTIFRTQSPYVFEEDGVKKYKSQCYVFDFAPDRSLKMLAETAKFSTLKQSQKKNAKNVGSHDDDIQKMKDFLKFCPVISLDGAMKEFDAERLFTQLNQVYIDRVVRNGFNDNSLYDVQALLALDVDNLNALGDIIAKSSNLEKPPKAKPLPTGITVTTNGVTGTGKPDKPTGDDDQKDDEDDEEKRKKKARREERDRRIKIIRGLALRVPLMMYGAEVTSESEDITRDNFTKKIDDRSWGEFMPRGVTKEDFNKIRTAFNQSIFTGAGKKIRQLAHQADDMTVTERIQRIAEIFSYFHNPDKETVLTPWRVVNMHMSDAIGGYCFFNESFTGPNQIVKYNTNGTLFEYVDTNEPRFVNQEGVTEKVFFDRAPGSFDLKSKILEINSKTGLYPLYVAYTLFRARKADFEKLDLIEDTSKYSIEEEHAIWDDILLDNIYVVCNTEMAARITKRTLVGFRKFDESRLHIQHIKLVEEATKDQAKLVKKLNSKAFWSVKGEGEMKFNAIVGNPPYQMNIDQGRSLATQLFPKFIDLVIHLDPAIWSLITPQKWFTADGQDNSFPKLRELVKQNNKFSVIVSDDGKRLFPHTDLGMVSYYLWDANHSGDVRFVENGNSRDAMHRPLFERGMDIILPQNKFVTVIKKIVKSDFTPLNAISTGRDAFGITGKNFVNRSKDHEFKDSVKVQCAYEEFRYIPRSEIADKGLEILDSYKVFTSKGNGGAGLLTDNKAVAIIGKSYVAIPGVACTDSLIPFGRFKTKIQAVNLQKYMSSKFLRFLVGILKVSQNLYQNVYSFVPLQDFGKNSDIDWTKSIAEIDQQLYKKYKLTKDEIAFIESMIKPME